MRVRLHEWKSTLRQLGFRTERISPTKPAQRGRVSAIESLESRQLLSGQSVDTLAPPSTGAVQQASATYELSGGQWNAKFDGLGRLNLADADAATLSPASWTPLPMPSAVVFQGKDFINDTLSLDLSTLPRLADNSYTIKTIIFNGGAGGFDTLKVSGGSFHSEVYSPTGKDSGVITYDGLTVIYTGLEPVVDNITVEDFTVEGTEGDDNITVAEAGQDENDQQNMIVSEANDNFENVTFTNKTNVTVAGLGGNDIINVSATHPSDGLESLTLDGGDGDDTLQTAWFGPIISGYTLAGGGGSDTYVMNSAAGYFDELSIVEDDNLDSDTLDFSDVSSTGITVDLSSTATQSPDYGTFGTLTLSSGVGIENVIGSAGNDTITGNSRDNSLEGGAGDDSLSGGSGNDTYIFDPLVAVYGNLGSDTITESANSDSDTLDMSNFNSDQPITLDLSSTASQTVSSGVLSLTLSSATGIENVLGGAGEDDITGNTRNNILVGGDAGNTLIGGDGDDRLYGGAGDDQLQGNAGSDALYGQDGDDTLYGGTGNDYLYGGTGTDTLSDYDHSGSTTEGGNDYLDGGDGDDTLYGYSGSDTLIGGAGDDALHGGTGDDTYTYIWHPGDYGLGADTIYENSTEGNDTVDLSHFFSTDYSAPVVGTSGTQTVSNDQVSDPIDPDADQVVRDSLTITFATTSTVDSVTGPGTFTSSVAAIAGAPPDANGALQFVALGVQGTYDSLKFYYDSNGNGVLDGSDQLLGTDTDGSDGWGVSIPYDDSQGGWIADDGSSTLVKINPGKPEMFAVAADAGTPGDPASALLAYVDPIPLADKYALKGTFTRDTDDSDLETWVKAEAYGGLGGTHEFVTPEPDREDVNHTYAHRSKDVQPIETNNDGGTAYSTAAASARASDDQQSRVMFGYGYMSTTADVNSVNAQMKASPQATIEVANGGLIPNISWELTPSSIVKPSISSLRWALHVQGVIAVGWYQTAEANGAGASASASGEVSVTIYGYDLDNNEIGSKTVAIHADTSTSTGASATLTVNGNDYSVIPLVGAVPIPFDFTLDATGQSPARISVVVSGGQEASVAATATNANANGKVSYMFEAHVDKVTLAP